LDHLTVYALTPGEALLLSIIYLNFSHEFVIPRKLLNFKNNNYENSKFLNFDFFPYGMDSHEHSRNFHLFPDFQKKYHVTSHRVREIPRTKGAGYIHASDSVGG
jgi:hypothetical protein